MKAVILDIRPPGEAMTDFDRVRKAGKAERSARFSCATPERLRSVLTAKRRALPEAMRGAGPMSIREASRRVERDAKGVHGDLTARLNAGVLDRVADGRVVLAFEAVEVEFLLHAA